MRRMGIIAAAVAWTAAVSIGAQAPVGPGASVAGSRLRPTHRPRDQDGLEFWVPQAACGFDSRARRPSARFTPIPPTASPSPYSEQRSF